MSPLKKPPRLWVAALRTAFAAGLACLNAAPGYALLPDALCTAAPPTDVANEALEKTAALIELRLISSSVTPGDLAVVSATKDTKAEHPGIPANAALSRYCAAAGEAYRTASWGSQAVAQNLLLAALRFAESAHEGALSARAAYRLGLATSAGSATSGTRGARRTIARDLPGAVVQSAPPTAADDPCAMLADDGAIRLAPQALIRAALECAAARARTVGDYSVAALAQLRLAQTASMAAERTPFTAASLRDQAKAALAAGLRDAMMIAPAELRATILGRMGEAALDSGAAKMTGLAEVPQAMRAAAPKSAETAAIAAALEGRMALAQQDLAKAGSAFQQAIFAEGQRVQPLRMADWLLLLAQAQPNRRATLVPAAYRALQSVRAILPSADPLTEESTFRRHIKPVFEAAIALELGDAVGIAAAQEIIEAYREAELQSAFGANCVPSRDPIRPEDLRPGEVLLYPILLDDRVELIVASQQAQGVARYERLSLGERVSRDAIGRLVSDIVAAMSQGESDSWREPAARLYALLIKPIEQRLSAAGTLVIVPDGPLRGLPFAALLDENGKFLIERTRLTIAPALAYSQPGKDRGSRPLEIVAAALELEVVLPAGTFAKLEGTGKEAQSAVGPGKRIIQDFREADLRRELDGHRVDVLHLATHAAFNGRSDRSFIVANQEAIPISELRALIQSSRARGDDLELLVLSACETAIGDDQASMGLAGAAVQSGATSAIASLWEVSDTGTVALMQGFYDRYRAGMGKAAALQGAQLALIGSGGELADPQIWAAFTLLGGWR